MQRKSAVILLSGGLDSATTAAIALKEGYALSALTFNYNQRHVVEIQFAHKLADFFKIRDHRIIDIPSHLFNTALVKNSSLEVPKNTADQEKETDIPVTYVPGRNIIFLAFALAYAESIVARDIFIGANAIDYSGYPDCRPEFFAMFTEMANAGTKAGVMGNGFTIHTPLILLTKAEIIKKGMELGVDYSLTHSCYDPSPNGSSCGTCDSCLFRKNGFRAAGVPDPTRYRDSRS